MITPKSSICLPICMAFIALFPNDATFGQSKILWEKAWTTANQATGLTTSKEGNAVVVGSAVSSRTGKDIAFSIIDPLGKLLTDTVIVGGTADDAANAIVATDDGGYLLAGSTQSARRGQSGKRDGWLLKTDETGKPLWDKLYGTSEDDEFISIVADGSGTGFYVAGKSGSDFWVLKVKPNGQQVWAFRSKVVLNAQVTTLRLSADGHRLFLVGYEEVERRQRGLVICLNTEGSLIWEKTYENAALSAATTDTPNGELWLAGMTFSKKNYEDMLFLAVDPTDGTPLRRYAFGGDGTDWAKAIIADFDGGFLLIGNSTSQRRGQRFEDVAVYRVDAKGQSVWTKPLFIGGNNSDLAAAAHVLPNGDVLAVGKTANDGWLIDLGKIISSPKGIGTGLIITNGRFVDEDENGILNQDERAFYEVFVENTGDADLPMVNLTVKQEAGVLNLKFSPTVSIGLLRKGVKRRVTIPLSMSGKLASGQNSFVITTNEAIAVPHRFSFMSAKKVESNVIVKRAVFSTDDKNMLRRKASNTLTFDIENTGDTTAENLKLTCFFPNSVRSIGETVMPIFKIEAGEKQSIVVNFIVNSDFKDSILRIVYTLQDQAGGFLVENNAKNGVYSVDVNDDEPTKVPTNSGKFVKIEWRGPYPDEIPHLNSSTFQIKLKATSSLPLTAKNFRVLIDGKPLDDGSKFDNVSLKTASNGQANTYPYDFLATFDLKNFEKNRAEIAVEVSNEAGKATSEPIEFVYDIKPNLYMVSIGVPSNLKYTTKDPEDLAAAFRSQQGKLFSKVNIGLNNTADKTTYNVLTHTIEDLKYAPIRKQDVLVLFLSTHGKAHKGRRGTEFFLFASDTDLPYLGSTSIDFDRHILSILEVIDCKKLIIIDACESGAVSDALVTGAKSNPSDQVDEAVKQLIEAKAGLRCILSSEKNEKSWEDDEWQNGALTEAMLEAFDNKTMPTEKGKICAHQKPDAVLMLTELFDYVNVRVPFMVQQRKTQPQHPVILPRDAENFPIFMLKK